MPSPSTIQDLKTAIGGIDDEIRSMDERKAELQRQRGALVTTLRFFGDDGADLSPPPSPMTTAGGGDGARGSGSLDDAIFAVLSAERPLHRSDIHDRVVEMGVSVRGLNPVNNVTAHMSLDPRFHSVGNGMWDLVDPPTPSAEEPNNNYDSQDEEDEEDNVPW